MRSCRLHDILLLSRLNYVRGHQAFWSCQGRFMVADTEELREWLGKESHMPAPAHVATEGAGEDISKALKESVSAIRRQKRP